MTTEQQIELARKFAGRFSSATRIGQDIANAVTFCANTVKFADGFIPDLVPQCEKTLAILARAETLLAEADAKPAERVCEWTYDKATLDDLEGFVECVTKCGDRQLVITNFCPHCGGRVMVKDA